MTAVTDTDRQQPGPAPLQEIASEHRPPLSEAAQGRRTRRGPLTPAVGVALLAVLGLLYGAHTRQSRLAATVPQAVGPRIAPRSDVIVLQGDAPGASVPMATRSVEDLEQWATTRPAHPAPSGDLAVDTPAHVHLYSSRRIVLVPAGTPVRVLAGQGPWRRIQVLDGLYRGETGYVSQDVFARAR